MNLAEKFKYMAIGKPYDDVDDFQKILRNQLTEMTNQINNENNKIKKEKLIRQLFDCEFGLLVRILFSVKVFMPKGIFFNF